MPRFELKLRDVSHQSRDWRGRWTAGGSILSRDPLEGVELKALTDDQLCSKFAEISRSKRPSEDALRRIDLEFARREDNSAEMLRAIQSGMDTEELNRVFDDLSIIDNDAVQRRIDQLVAQGVDYRNAYADAHGLDEADLSRADLAAIVDAQRRPGETREKTVKRLYAEVTMMQMLRAEEWTRGNLLNRAAQSESIRRQKRGAGQIHPLDLFSGPRATARKWAAEELKRFWEEVEPRQTYTEFRAMMLGRSADVRAAERIRNAGNERDFGL